MSFLCAIPLGFVETTSNLDISSKPAGNEAGPRLFCRPCVNHREIKLLKDFTIVLNFYKPGTSLVTTGKVAKYRYFCCRHCS